MPEIQNPNLQSQGSGGGGGDMRSTMAFMLLAMAAIFGYQYFFAKPKPDQQPPAQTQSQPAAPAGSTAPAAPGQTPNAAAQAPSATPQVSAPLETYTTVENEFYKIVFTNRGGQVKNWILKKYFDSAGKPLDLVQPQAAARFGLPLSLYTYEPALTTQLNDALYQVSYGGAQPSATGQLLAPATITFHYSANGIDAVKTFSFGTSYVVNIETEVKRNGAPVRTLVEWPSGLGDMEELHQTSMLRGQMPTPSFFAWSIGDRQDVLAAAKVSGNNTLEASYQYAAVMDLYFAAAFLPEVPDSTTVVTLHNSIELSADPSDPNSKKTSVDVVGLAVGDTSGDTRLRLFAGPKATELLKSIHATGADGKADGPGLESLIQFGSWLGVIAKPLYYALRFLRNFIGAGAYSWGWAIILFTAVFNMRIHPIALHDDEVVAQDDAHPAQGRCHQEALFELEDERPQEERDEHGGHGPLQGRRASTCTAAACPCCPSSRCSTASSASSTTPSNCASRTGSGCPISRSPIPRTFCPCSSSSPCFSRSTSRPRPAWILCSGA